MCCGKHLEKRANAKASGAIYPNTQCALCAEKHVSAAYELSRECGYETPNRQAIIGHLTLAATHLYKSNRELAELVRTVRHAVQNRAEAAIDWLPLLAEIDALATAEAKNLENKT